jgi:putative methyltransferase (TIGR04325 family)
MKEFIRLILPPFILRFYHFLFTKNNALTVWNGDFANWEEAKNECKGSYEEANILETCKNALLKVKNGEAVYERDGVLFDQKVYSWPMLAYLQKIAIENSNQLTVLDFGGSLGSTYYQNKDFLSPKITCTWCIIEQHNFVETGKKHFENDSLKFYFDIESCLKEHKPTVLILSSVLQYLENPDFWMAKFNTLGIKHIVIDRTAMIDAAMDRLTIQKTSKEIYEAEYPSWFFGKNKIATSFTNYTILTEINSDISTEIYLGDIKCCWKSYYLIQQ